MAAIDYSDDALDDLHLIAVECDQTAFRLMNRLYSWANRTPPIPSGSERLEVSMPSVYQRKCKIDNQEFTINFVYPHGNRKCFLVVGVFAATQHKMNSVETVVEDDIYELDN